MSIKIERSPITTEGLEAELKGFEHDFQMSSEDFINFYEMGEIAETPETREWSILYTAWEIAKNGQRS